MNPASRIQRPLGLVLLLGVVVTTCVGCQTFALSSEEFEVQQNGKMVDPEAGACVGLAGTVGYLGVLTGVVVAGALK
ncbi:MAG: hypothetical protein JNK85_00910 [Verrucomicrobiales bacterium]|nr:hypothetical protein [Verrucomicrobiales bacterium]